MSSLALALPMAWRMLLRMATESSLFQSCSISRSIYASPSCPVGSVSAAKHCLRATTHLQTDESVVSYHGLFTRAWDAADVRI